MRMRATRTHDRSWPDGSAWAAVAAAGLVCATTWSALGQEQRAAARPDPSGRKWDATAPGRIEPRSPDVRVSAGTAGRITEVRVKTNDKVFPGQLLVRLDDEEALARLAAAQAQVDIRERARDEQRRKGPADLR